MNPLNISTRFRTSCRAAARRLGFVFLALLLQCLPVCGAPPKIMSLGDSITRGNNDINYPNGDILGGYRKKLGELLASGGYVHDFVGERIDNAAAGMDPDHNGNPNWRTDELLAALSGYLIREPDVVLLMAGTNDILQVVPVSTAVVNLENLILQITATRPSCRLFVATILPITQNWFGQPAATLNANANAFNTQVRNLAAALAAAGRKVTLVDMNALITLQNPNPLLNFYQPGDGVHPGQAGYNQLGTLWFNAITAAGTLAGARSNLIATVASPSRVNLTWNDPAADEAQQEVWSRNHASGVWQRVATLPANVTSFAVTGLKTGVQTHSFAISAHNAAGLSGWSNVAVAMAQGEKAHLKPASASASYDANYTPPKANDGLLTTLWASGGTANHYWQVDLSAAHHVQQVQAVTRQDGDYAVHRKSFEVRVSNDPSFTTFTALGGQGDTPLPFKATLTLDPVSLPAFRYLRVAKTDEQSFALSLVRVFGGVQVPLPSVPSGFAAQAIDSGTVRLSWNVTSNNESGFRIERKTGAGAFVSVASQGVAAGSHLDRNLATATTYTYRIFAVNESGDSSASPEITVTTATAGAYDLWTEDYPAFMALPASERLPDADPNGDGIPNLLAYAAGADPMDSRATTNLANWTVVPPAGMFFTYRRNKAAPDLTYEALVSADLASGGWTVYHPSAATVSAVPGNPEVEDVSVPVLRENAPPWRFARLRVTRN